MITSSMGLSRRAALLAASVLTAFGSTSAYAQTAATAQAGADSGNAGDIVVTARKSSEKLQDVPLTITALSADTIRKTDTNSIFDLATRTPGLYYGTSGGRNGGNKLQIRNLSTGTAGGSKASVFIDGVFMSGDYASTPLANLERVEVLKGPQSVYFGRSTFVGAVNFVTRDPGAKFEGRLDATAATLGEYELTGYLTTPIVGDTLSNTVSGRAYSFRGPDAWTGPDGYHYGNQRTLAVSDKLALRPTDNLTIRWYNSYVYDRDHIPQTTYAPLSSRNLRIVRPDGTVSYYFSGPVNIDHSLANADNLYATITKTIPNPGVERKQFRSVLSFDWKFGAGYTLSGFAGYSHERLLNNYDGNYIGAKTVVAQSPSDVATTYIVNQANLYYNFLTQDKQAELRITSPAEDKVRFTLGYNYTKVYGSTAVSYSLVNPAGAVYFSGSLATTTNTVLLNPNETQGLFGGLYIDLAKSLTASGEVRFQDDHVTAFNGATNFSQHYRSILPRFNINWKPNSDINLYAIYSVGNNPGGFNSGIPASFIPSTVPLAFGEEKLYNYEVGIKTTWLGGRLLINLAAYHMNWKNEQVQQSYVTNRLFAGSLDSLYNNNASSVVNGFEAEADARLSSDFSLRATASYGKAKYVQFCSSNFYALTGVQTSVGCRSVAGKQQEGTPALQLSLFADYTHPISDDLAVFVRADYQYQSKIYLDEFNYAWMSPANLAGLRVGVQSKNWSFEAFVRNLFDDDHSSRSTRVGYSALVPAQVYPNTTFNGVSVPSGNAGTQDFADTARRPRQFGVKAGVKF